MPNEQDSKWSGNTDCSALLCSLIAKTQSSHSACSFPILPAFQESEAVLEPVMDFALSAKGSHHLLHPVHHVGPSHCLFPKPLTFWGCCHLGFMQSCSKAKPLWDGMLATSSNGSQYSGSRVETPVSYVGDDDDDDDDFNENDDDD